MRFPALIGLFLLSTAASAQDAPPRPSGSYVKAHQKTSPPPNFWPCKPPAGQRYKMLLGFTVDASGKPINLAVQLSTGIPCLDEAATQAVRAYDFDPATQDGTPVAEGLALEFTFAISSKSGASYALAAPVEKSGGDVSKPVVLESAAPHYSRSIFHPNYPAKPAIVIVGLTVDIDGLPQNVHIVSSENDLLDKSALDAVRKFRFKPAMKAGKPVPVEIQTAVNYEVKQ